MVIKEHKPIVRLSVDDREIIELLGHYNSQMLESRMRVFINVIADCTVVQEAEIFVRSHDNAGLALAMMN
jgi:hypothetical protein